MEEQLVEFEYLGSANEIGVARLVREKPLNSLLLDTINQLAERIYAWLDDDGVKCIVLDSSSERAFCAGADITALYHSIKAADGGSNPYGEAFFLNEYRLDHALHTAEKPVVVWGNGIVMGGGLGLMGGCSHRVATPSTRIAMPEITIGLFPDAGGTAFLSGLPDGLGLFAGLTGCQLGAGDALELGLVDYIVDPESKADMLEKLAGIDWTLDASANRDLVSATLADLEGLPGPGPMLDISDEIVALMARCTTADDFFQVFEAGLGKLKGDWIEAAVANYVAGSGVTARVFLEQMRRARGMSLADMFRMELTIAYQCIRHPDFPEGVRALLVDKDRSPSWSYSRATDVPDEVVQAHFQPAWSGPHPLADL